MTTRVEITCKGPHELEIWFYDFQGNRTSDPAVRLAVGETYAFDTHDGKRAMPFSLGNSVKTPAADDPPRFHAIPHATY